MTHFSREGGSRDEAIFAQENAAVESNVEEGRIFMNPEEAANFLFQSFKYSQKDGGLHQHILNYARAEHPAFRLRKEDMQEFDQCFEKMVEKYFGMSLAEGRGFGSGKQTDVKHHANVRYGQIVEEVRDFSRFFKELFAGNSADETTSDFSKERRLTTIIVGMVNRDANYFDRGSRPGGRLKSLLCEDVLSGESSGSAPLDAVFADMRSAYESGVVELSALERLRLESVVSKHNEMYPEKEVGLPPKLKNE